MPLTDGELHAYSQEHVYYEVEMLLILGEIFRTVHPPTAPRERTILNALVQSFAIHLRNLIAFLYPERVQRDDVIAEHFMADPDRWRRALPPLSDTLRRARERAHKEVAHLTTLRMAGTPPEKAWDPALIEEVRCLMRLFVTHAAPERLHPRVGAILNNPLPPIG